MANEYVFPPIVDTYQEAAVIGREDFMEIFFTDPNPNNTYPIEVSVRDQNTNKSILTSGDVLTLNKVTVDDLTKIIIKEDQLKCIVDQWYKVQLRYVIEEGEFSEWSTVTLVKVIGQPTLDIKLYNSNKDDTTGQTTLNSSYIKLNGKLSFDSNSKEELKSYQISLWSFNDKVLERTKIFYPTSKNEIEPITLKTSLKKFSQGSYIIKVDYETKGFYKGTQEEEFSYSSSIKLLEGKTFFSADPLNEKGYIQLQIGLKELPMNTNGFSIYRASYLDQYSQREKVIYLKSH